MVFRFSGMGRMREIFTFLVGQSCRSALNSWAARQRRPTEDMKVFVLRPAGWGSQIQTLRNRPPGNIR
jgi:hypothetical protein